MSNSEGRISTFYNPSNPLNTLFGVESLIFWHYFRYIKTVFLIRSLDKYDLSIIVCDEKDIYPVTC